MLSSSFAQQFLNEKSYISVNTIFETISVDFIVSRDIGNSNGIGAL